MRGRCMVHIFPIHYPTRDLLASDTAKLVSGWGLMWAVGKTGRGVGAGVGDQWVKPRDWEIT